MREISKIRLLWVSGVMLMTIAVYIIAPYGSMFLVHWPWLVRFEPNNTMTIWGNINLGEAGVQAYQKIVFVVGLPLAAIATLLMVLSRRRRQRLPEHWFR